MKRIIAVISLISAILCLTSCRTEPPALSDSFSADFSVTDGTTEYSGNLEKTDSGLRVTFSEPYTVSGMSFEYTDEGMSIGSRGLSTLANSDYIPSRAVPSVLHNTTAYISQAAYKGSEDGEDIFTLPTPYGEAELRAINGAPISLSDSPSGLTFTFHTETQT